MKVTQGRQQYLIITESASILNFSSCNGFLLVPFVCGLSSFKRVTFEKFQIKYVK